METWPAYAKIVAGEYAPREAVAVRRSRFEDGAVRQEKLFTAAFTSRSVVALLDDDAARLNFRAWADLHGHAWFEWHDPEDGTGRRVRIVNGAGGVEYRPIVTPERERRWEARMDLEGLWSDEVGA